MSERSGERRMAEPGELRCGEWAPDGDGCALLEGHGGECASLATWMASDESDAEER